ncbi:Ig-like domain-containing protein [Brachybacterium sp. DNPG3]
MTVVSAAILSVASLVITGFALHHPGLTSSRVTVSDGGVWVTSAQDGLMGRINVDAQEIDGKVDMIGTDLDILQSGYDVIEVGPHGFTPINTTSEKRNGLVELDPGYELALGGDRVAIAYPDGRVWVLSPAEAAAFSPDAAEPVHQGEGKAPSITVSDAGTLFVLEGSTLTSYAREDSTRDTRLSSTVELEGVSTDAEQLQLTTVGEAPVVLDEEHRTLLLGDDGTAVALSDFGVSDASALALQQPGGTSGSVLLATSDALLEVPLDGGDPVSHAVGGSGNPVAPAQVDGCLYGAWNDSDLYLRSCAGQEDAASTVPDVDSDADLVLRVNEGLVVLNDQQLGRSWLISDEMQIVENWAVTNPLKSETASEDRETLSTTIENAQVDRTQENRPPIAQDDVFGVRPGESVVLPITRNDTDLDGDIITASLQGEQPAIGTVTAIEDGTQLQIDVVDDASGTADFTYLADDGRGGQDTATVTLEVKADDENSGPVPADSTALKLTVRSGRSTSINVLPYWQDPEGDAFYLANATVPPEDLVTFRADGTVTYNDAGLETGTKQIQLTFRDERGTQSEGVLEVDVVDDTDIPPITSADHVRAVVGRSATIKPLANDLNPNGGDLELTHVTADEDLETEVSLETGTITVSGAAEGIHYLEYTAAATGSGSTSPGIIRVDVEEPDAQDLAPVAVDDMGAVVVGDTALVDPLENDVDPAGGILVLNGIDVPEGSGLEATVVEHHLVRLTASPDAVVGSEPVEIGYEVAGTSGSARGTLRVMIVSTDTQLANPDAVPDTATVRAGDMTTIDVLANDDSPSGAELSLGQLTDTGALDALGHLETHADRIRFTADPDASGEASLTYQVVDDTGRVGSARLTITVVPVETANTSPRPENLTARTVSGSAVRIPVTTDGIDPEGDSVILTGITSPTPQLGEVTAIDGQWIEYTPFPGVTGTDRFSYQVMDRQGAIGTAEVLVGIAEPSDTNQYPDAVDDVVDARPGREVQVQALANDTDPEGAVLSIDRTAVEAITAADGTVVEVLDPEESAPGVVTVVTPEAEGTYTVVYGASDGQLTDTASITLRVSEDAPQRSPVAYDDFVSAADVLDTENETIPVEVLANDIDPDGSTSDLTVTLPDAVEGAEVVDGTRIVVTPQDDLQRIRYRIEDLDGLDSYGYIWVPGLAKQAPTWVGGTLEVGSGEELAIDLSDTGLVRVRPGGQPAVVTDPSAASAVHSDGSALVADERTLVYRSAEGFSGDDAITVEVTDGESGDETAATAVLTIPVQVIATEQEEENRPPTIQGAPLQVEQGGGAASIDLAVGTADPEGDELVYAMGEYVQDPQVAIALEGSVLTATASAEASKGTVVEVPVTVADGTNDPVPASIQVSVTKSTRPLISATLDTGDIDAGQSGLIDVLANDSNPFEGGERTITSASVTSEGAGSAEVVDGQVRITVDDDFHGVLHAQYTVLDDTGDIDRKAVGEIEVGVRGAPEAPSVPRIVEAGDGFVTIAITAGADNGAPITEYRVTSPDHPEVAAVCTATSCTIDGLTNDVEYTFQAVAVNDVGTSDASGASASARPDVRPGTPAAPTVERGDGQLTVRWSAPENRGSALQKYVLQKQDAATGEIESVELDASSTVHVWSGLTNGTSYRFSVRAYNRADAPSDASSWSAAEHPAGAPKTPSGVITATRIDDVMGGGVKVSLPAMGADEANGESIRSYIVTASDGSTRTITAVPGTNTTTFRSLDPDTAYTFTYAAVNSVGTGPSSAASKAVTPYSVPSAPGTVTATLPDTGSGDGPDGRVDLSWSAAVDNGTRIDGYVISWSGGSTTVDAGTTSTRISNLTNGKAYTFTVAATNRFGEVSGGTSSSSVTPYTRPGSAQISSSAGTCTNSSTCTVTFTITATGDDGGGGSRTLHYAVDGGETTSVSSTSQTITITSTSGASHSVEAWVENGKGLTSEHVTKTQAAQTYTAPTPQGTVVFKGKSTNQACTNTDFCRLIDVRYSSLEPGKTYQVYMTTRATDSPYGEQQDAEWPINGTEFTASSSGTWSSVDAGYNWHYGFKYNAFTLYLYDPATGTKTDLGTYSLPQ